MFKRLGNVVQIVGLILIAGSLAWSAVKSQVYIDNAGIPFNSPGRNCSCPRCNNIWTIQQGHYEYSCDKCGAEYECQLDGNKRKVYGKTNY